MEELILSIKITALIVSPLIIGFVYYIIELIVIKYKTYNFWNK